MSDPTEDPVAVLREAHRRAVQVAQHYGTLKELGDALDAFDTALDALVAERDRYRQELRELQGHVRGARTLQDLALLREYVPALSTDQEAT